MIKLGELVAQRASIHPRMTVATSSSDGIPDGFAVIVPISDEDVDVLARCTRKQSAEVIASTLNATAVLLEIAQAAQAWVAEYRDGRDPRAEDQARWRLYGALERVTP